MQEKKNLSRRQMMRNMGYALGYATITPSIIATLDSCRNPETEVVTGLLNGKQMKLISQLVDTILPKTDTPSGTELGLDKFAVSVMENLLPTEGQKKTIAAIDKLLSHGNSPKELLDKFLSSNNTAPEAEVLRDLRSTLIWGYRTHPKIGEEYLAYDPVPATYVACGSVNELSGGKAWSPNT